MCPLFPFHIVILYLCLVLPLLLAVAQGAEEIAQTFLSSNPLKQSGRPAYGSLKFLPNQLKTEELNVSEVEVACMNCHFPDLEPGDDTSLKLVLEVQNPNVATIQGHGDVGRDDELEYKEIVMDLRSQAWDKAANWSAIFKLTGEFLGFTKVKGMVVRRGGGDGQDEPLIESSLPVAVKRKKTIQSKLFSYSVAILVSLAYINMGCAMDLAVVKQTLKRPVGPLIGFCCQYVVMPLIAFGLGFLFYGDAPMRLGLFVTGCSPGGGASNMWTVMFGGNLDLSVTMTAVSTFAAFFMMPAWIFTLGQHLIVDDDNVDIVIPYYKICIYAFFLVVPLCIGFLTSRFFPKVAAFLARILKPLALFLILFILVFGIWANLYIFSFMGWQVIVAGMGLPWIGFAFGCTLARLFGQSKADVIAIAIETGVQNTGMSIFILWFTLDHPLGDITAVVPVAAATMTPLPLLAALAVKKLLDMRTERAAGYALEDQEGAEPNPDYKNGDIWCQSKTDSNKNDSIDDGETAKVLGNNGTPIRANDGDRAHC